MPTKSKVAVLFTKPETVLQDYERLMHLADVKQHLDPSATTILKDNISWHFPFPSANSTPWQLEANVVRWFAGIVGYPETARGILTTGGSLANFTAVVTARWRDFEV